MSPLLELSEVSKDYRGLRPLRIASLTVAAGERVALLGLDAAAAEALAWRDSLVRQLQRAGVLVLDAAPGDVTPKLVKRYLEIKARRLL